MSASTFALAARPLIARSSTRPLQPTTATTTSSLRHLTCSAVRGPPRVLALASPIHRAVRHSLLHPTPTSSSSSSSIITSSTYSRFYSSAKPEPTYTISELSDDDYHAVSDACMDRMVEYFEDLGDEHEIPGYDVEYQSGVMTLKLGDKGTYVVNKQPPNKQLWLSSPTTGPKRYDYDATHKTWFYGRDHHSLTYLLNTEISEAIGIDIAVPLDGTEHDD
ncbi:Mitochondrial chaperone Frataxin [Mortierella claussenii]|nr:Mitochondrial chaperone Frataxin [Mortierella claussenii]